MDFTMLVHAVLFIGGLLLLAITFALLIATVAIGIASIPDSLKMRREAKKLENLDRECWKERE